MKRVIYSSNYVGHTLGMEPDPTGKGEAELRFLSSFKSWTDVYQKFIEISNKYDPSQEEEIEDAVYQFYSRGQGYRPFQEAYRRWLDTEVE